MYFTVKLFDSLTTTVTCHCHNRVREKVVIITGSSSGIGSSTALDLAKKGNCIIAAYMCTYYEFRYFYFNFSKCFVLQLLVIYQSVW